MGLVVLAIHVQLANKAQAMLSSRGGYTTFEANALDSVLVIFGQYDTLALVDQYNILQLAMVERDLEQLGIIHIPEFDMGGENVSTTTYMGLTYSGNMLSVVVTKNSESIVSVNVDAQTFSVGTISEWAIVMDTINGLVSSGSDGDSAMIDSVPMDMDP